MATTTTQYPASEPPTGTRPLRDFRQEVTDNVVQMLENGVAPWQKPWDATANMPMNPTSARAYRGGNAIHLLATALQKGYQDPRWMTYKQAADHDWQVRRGEKGTQIEFWDVKQGKERRTRRRSSLRSGRDRHHSGSHDDAIRIYVSEDDMML